MVDHPIYRILYLFLPVVGRPGLWETVPGCPPTFIQPKHPPPYSANTRGGLGAASPLASTPPDFVATRVLLLASGHFSVVPLGNSVATGLLALATGGDRLGDHWPGNQQRHTPDSPQIHQKESRETHRYNKELGRTLFIDDLRPKKVASNGRVLRTRPYSSLAAPWMGASGRAAVSQPCGPLNRKTPARRPSP